MPTGLLSIALAGVVSSASGPVADEPDPTPAPSGALALRWHAPPSCPDEASVRARLDEFLGGRPHRAATAEGTIVADDEGFTLTLAIEGQTKQVHALDCEDLGRTAALVLSIALAPEQPEPEPEPELEPEPEPEPTPEPAPVPTRASGTPEPVSPPPSPSRLRGAVRAEGAVHYGITRDTSDAALVVAMVWPRARLEIPATLWTPSGVPPSDAAGRRGRTTIGTVGARGCWTPKLPRRRASPPGRGPLEFPVCGGAELGAVRFAVLGNERDVRHGLWAAASVTAAVAWPVHRLVALWAGPTGIVVLRRPRFSFEGTADTYRIGPAALRIFVGVELRFP